MKIGRGEGEEGEGRGDEGEGLKWDSCSKPD